MLNIGRRALVNTPLAAAAILFGWWASRHNQLILQNSVSVDIIPVPKKSWGGDGKGH